MKQAVQIRPEQARALIALNTEAEAAQQRFGVALGAVLAGLVTADARVLGIEQDGTVTCEVPEVPT